MVGRKVLPVPGVAEEVLLGVENVKRHRGRVPIFAMSHDVFRLGLWLDAVEDFADRHTGPGVTETTPAGDAVDVCDDVLGMQRVELVVVEGKRVFDGAEYLEIPGFDVRLGHRAEVEQRPAIWRGEGLAGRDASWIDPIRQALGLEQERHVASIGIARRRAIVSASEGDFEPGYTGLSLSYLNTGVRSSIGRALESHSRGKGFESPRIHQFLALG